jgi:pyrroline-5-carboxylate reductase
MEIVIIGTGNTATVLGKKLKKAGHRILQVYGRNSSAATTLAYELETESTNSQSIISKQADIYIVAVSDNAIEDVLTKLDLPQKPIVHTAASVPLNTLRPFSTHYGVLYPLQSLKKGVTGSTDIPILIDANDTYTLNLLETLANSISTNVTIANDDVRLKLHLAAVFCNNFVNHIYHLIQNYCVEEGLNFRLLTPLIQETANRLKLYTPAQSQTGPAIRNDVNTISKHLSLLNTHPHLKELYDLLTKSIQKLH